MGFIFGFLLACLPALEGVGLEPSNFVDPNEQRWTASLEEFFYRRGYDTLCKHCIVRDTKTGRVFTEIDMILKNRDGKYYLVEMKEVLRLKLDLRRANKRVAKDERQLQRLVDMVREKNPIVGQSARPRRYLVNSKNPFMVDIAGVIVVTRTGAEELPNFWKPNEVQIIKGPQNRPLGY